uniref:Uncharacterized protein n=1 Tax=Cacopsylla melanoneura TaxID=428564 RepID=A0A8D8SAQ0_9HEMI
MFCPLGVAVGTNQQNNFVFVKFIKKYHFCSSFVCLLKVRACYCSRSPPLSSCSTLPSSLPSFSATDAGTTTSSHLGYLGPLSGPSLGALSCGTRALREW